MSLKRLGERTDSLLPDEPGVDSEKGTITVCCVGFPTIPRLRSSMPENKFSARMQLTFSKNFSGERNYRIIKESMYSGDMYRVSPANLVITSMMELLVMRMAWTSPCSVIWLRCVIKLS